MQIKTINLLNQNAYPSEPKPLNPNYFKYYKKNKIQKAIKTMKKLNELF